MNNINNKYKRYRTCKNSSIFKDFSDEKEEKIFILIKEKRDNKLSASTKSIIPYACSLKIAFSNKKIDAQLRQVYQFIKRFGFNVR